MKTVAFYTGLALLLTHELDAIRNHEWRVLPLVRALPDALGQQAFIAAHIPLFAILIALIASLNTVVRERARIGLCAFLVVHAGLHFLFSGHAEYEFSSWLSALLIYGAAACGLAYFVTR